MVSIMKRKDAQLLAQARQLSEKILCPLKGCGAMHELGVARNRSRTMYVTCPLYGSTIFLRGELGAPYLQAHRTFEDTKPLEVVARPALEVEVPPAPTPPASSGGGGDKTDVVS